MTAFKFRWQTLLFLRERERDERRQELALACAEERTLIQQCDEIRGEQVRQQALRRQELRRQDLRQEQGGAALSVQRLRQGAEFENHLRGQLQLAEQAVARALADQENCRTQLAAAELQVRVLEKLRERRQAEHARATARSETRSLDEVGGRMPSLSADGNNR